jgi:hypothetical protein
VKIKQYPMIDLLRNGGTLQSIGSLRNVPLSLWLWHPMRIVGNSRRLEISTVGCDDRGMISL